MLKLLQNTKARYVISDSTPNRPYARRLFFAASKVSVCTIHTISKVIFDNNSGYKFNLNKMKCDQLGIADYYLVSTESAKNILLLNGIDERNIHMKKKDENDLYPIKQTDFIKI